MTTTTTGTRTDEVELLEAMWEVPSTDEQPALTGQELLEAARSSVRSLRSRRTQAAWVRDKDDDIVSDVIEASLRAAARGQNVHAGYVYSIARNLISRDRDMASSDARATRLLAKAVDELEQSQHAQATNAQIDRLAAQILDSWPTDAKRPSRTFQRRTSVVSMDAIVTAGGSVEVIADQAASLTTSSTEVEELMDRHESATGKAAHSAVRRGAWDALASTCGAPSVTARITKNRVTAIRSALAAHGDDLAGGIEAALSTWEAGETSEATDALFAPFANCDVDELDAAVQMLRTFASHADDLWLAALSAANTSFCR